MEKSAHRPPTQIERRIGYVFRDKSLLEQALTHSTYAYENPGRTQRDNERLEFIGDSVLALAVATALYDHPGGLTEGNMTTMRALVVRERSLAEAARLIGLGDALLLGVGEDRTGGRHKDSNLANALESLFGAVLLDGGFEAAADLILRLMRDVLERAIDGSLVLDFKSRLIEQIQARTPPGKVDFVLVREEGKEHERVFTSRVEIDGVAHGEGVGKSKKESEQAAAAFALRKLSVQAPDAPGSTGV